MLQPVITQFDPTQVHLTSTGQGNMSSSMQIMATSLRCPTTPSFAAGLRLLMKSNLIHLVWGMYGGVKSIKGD